MYNQVSKTNKGLLLYDYFSFLSGIKHTSFWASVNGALVHFRPELQSCLLGAPYCVFSKVITHQPLLYPSAFTDFH